MYSQSVFFVAVSAACLAHHGNRRQEVHLHHLDTCSLALLAAASGHIERETPGLESAYFSVRRILKQTPYVVKYSGKGSRIGTRRASDGTLVNFNDLVNVLDALQTAVGEGLLLGMIELGLQDGHQRFVDQRALAAAGHSAHSHQASQGETDIYALKIVAAGPLDCKELAAAGAAHTGYFYLLPSRQVLQRYGRIVSLGSGIWSGGAGVADSAAQSACSRANIYQPVGVAHCLFIMLHHYHRIVLVAQFFQRCNEFAVVPLMQTDGRLIEDIYDTYQLRSYLRGQPDALALASGKRCGGPVEREVFKPHVHQELEPVSQLAEHVACYCLAASAEFAVKRPYPGEQL